MALDIKSILQNDLAAICAEGVISSTATFTLGSSSFSASVIDSAANADLDFAGIRTNDNEIKICIAANLPTFTVKAGTTVVLDGTTYLVRSVDDSGSMHGYLHFYLTKSSTL